MYKGVVYKLELAFFHLILVPLIAFLPARIAYRIACFRGDLRYRWHEPMRQEITNALEAVLGDALSERQRLQIARRFVRLRSCEAVDIVRITLGKGILLKRLVEIRGLHYLKEALAEGKGAILGNAHYGSYQCCFALLGSCGFPITIVGRWPSNNPNRSAFERLVYKETLERPITRFLHRPNIEPWTGQIGVAVQAAKILALNEAVGTLLDPYVLGTNRRRAVGLKFLGGEARLLPGATSISRVTGAPILVTILKRSPDWVHQVLEISPSIKVEDDPIVAFNHCLSIVEGFIRMEPAHWIYWNVTALVKLGLLPSEMLAVSAIEDRED